MRKDEWQKYWGFTDEDMIWIENIIRILSTNKSRAKITKIIKRPIDMTVN